MSCCGGNCGCGSGCKCGSGCGGCKMYPEMDEGVTAGQTLVMGVAPSTKPSFEPSAGQTLVMGVAPSTKPSFETSAGAENDGGCTCSPCTCDPCTCK